MTESINSPCVVKFWDEYNVWNKRHEGLATLWLQDVSRWVSSFSRSKQIKFLLDFGCGYFDLGLSMYGSVPNIDGFDINNESCDIAEKRLKSSGINGCIFRKIEEITRGKYDLIVVNSVVQYFDNLDNLERYLSIWHELLCKNRQSFVLISDIIPGDYNPYRDALRSLIVAAKNHMLVPMFSHLWKAATKSSDLKLLQIESADLQKIIVRYGFTMEILPKNLTPSTQRYSVLLQLSR